MLLRAASGGSGGVVPEDFVATGNPATFTTDMAKPLKTLAVLFNPVQEGSGDPYAPGCGKNIFDVDTYPFQNGIYIGGYNGAVGTATAFAATEDYIPISKYAGQVVTLNKRPGGNGPGFAFYTKSGDTYTFLSGVMNSDVAAGTPWTFVIPAEAEYMRFTVPRDATEIQIEVGSSSTSYAPYSNVRNISGIDEIRVGIDDGESQPTIYTTSLEGTYYGGLLDVLNGTLLVTWEMKSGTWRNIRKNNPNPTTGYDQGSLEFSHDLKRVVNGSQYGVDVVCNIVHVVAWSMAGTTPEHLFIQTARYCNVFGNFDDDQVVQVAAKLATPFIVQLTSQQINALLGSNRITTDANGTVSVLYQSSTVEAYDHINVKKLLYIGNQYAFGNARYANKRDYIRCANVSALYQGVTISSHDNNVVTFNGGPAPYNDDTVLNGNGAMPVDMPAGTYVFRMEPHVGESENIGEKYYHIDLWYDGNETSTYDKRASLGCGSTVATTTFTTTEHAYKLRLWTGVKGGMTYKDYRIFYSLFPSDVTITDTNEPVPADGNLVVTLPSEMGLVNTMMHKSILKK